jgi:hypothetical protein
MTRLPSTPFAGLALAALALLAPAAGAAAIPGITGPSFNLVAKRDRVTTGDGNSLLLWGYASGSARAQYPGPTLIVNQGELVTVTFTNALTVPASIHFPGQRAVEAAGGVPGALVQEAPPGQTVTYTFRAERAGTFLYHSGTRPEVQVEMGLLGALIVRPFGFDHMNPRAYEHADSAYDREFLFLHSEMDPRIHRLVELRGVAALDATSYLSDYFSNYWFHNGRTAPDTMAAPFLSTLPTQPYNSFPRFHPGEKVLMRVIGGGRELHPFHFHGNHARVIARDARLLESAPGAGTDLSYELFTIPVHPGKTVDAVYEWTGAGLGWDAYGTADVFPHDCVDGSGDGFDDATHEWCADHYKPFPVTLPTNVALTFGGLWPGSPFLGASGSLPPGEGGMNPSGGFTFMWHSHREKELTNFGLFPGGAMSMVIVEAPWVPISESHGGN